MNDNLYSMNKYFIYALLCPKCGCPRYIGKTTKGVKRVNEHRKFNKHDDSWYKRNWIELLRKEGLTFNFTILTTLPSAQYLDEAERYWIKYFKDRSVPLTNLTDGGGGLYGKVMSDEVKAKIGAANKGRERPQELRNRISKTLTGRRFKRNRPLTDLEKKNLDRLHAIPPFKDQHGRIYKSLKEAAEMWKLSSSNICNVLKGKRKSTGGLEFSYL